MISDKDLLDLIARWPREDQDRLAAQIAAILRGERQAWYCNRGRKCDGNPHEGYMYQHARGDQWPPPGKDWRVWFMSGGRGSGKTRSGAEYTLFMSEKVSRIALVAPTGADVRDTMIEGVSGLAFCAALKGQRIDYEPSKRRVTFENGCVATAFSGEIPARLRGPQHGFAWMDEPAHIPLIEEAWSNLELGMRLGTWPHVLMTSTPLPTKWVKKRQAHPKTRVVRVSTYANRANLAEDFLEAIEEEYGGTRRGLQEIYGQVLEDVEGALWQGPLLIRADPPRHREDLDRIVVSIDPAGTANRKSDETGIVVAGKAGKNGYVLQDVSGKMSPQAWGTRALEVYRAWEADAIVVEKNYGGDMVKTVIERAVRDGEEVPRIIVKTATRSKQLRAEPVVALYEQGRVFHQGDLAELENEMLTWVPGQGDSPNRVDALVWAISDLMRQDGETRIASARKLKPRSPVTPGYNKALTKGLIDFSTLRRHG
jgi:phage terminase large subunit-like protein